jgi:hypothetical protein
MPTPYLDPAQNGQRDQITQALMNIANPPGGMPQQGMPPPMPAGGAAPQAAPMPPQQGMPPPGMPPGAPQAAPPPMMAGALGGLMQQPQGMPPQMPPQGMPPR